MTSRERAPRCLGCGCGCEDEADDQWRCNHEPASLHSIVIVPPYSADVNSRGRSPPAATVVKSGPPKCQPGRVTGATTTSSSAARGSPSRERSQAPPDHRRARQRHLARGSEPGARGGRDRRLCVVEAVTEAVHAATVRLTRTRSQDVRPEPVTTRRELRAYGARAERLAVAATQDFGADAATTLREWARGESLGQVA